MKLNIFVFKRKSAGFSYNPVFSQYSKEQYIDGFKQSLFDMKNEELENYKDLEIYHLGTFDNVSLKIDYNAEDLFVLDCAPVAIQVINSKGGLKDGKSN